MFDLNELNLPENIFAKNVSSEFKNSFLNDRQNERRHSEIARAKWVMFINKEATDFTKVLRSYGVSDEIIIFLTGSSPSTTEKKPKRKEKYYEIIEWCKTNHLQQVSIKKIAEIGKISYPTALKFANDRPDLFQKIKRGLYEVKNPEIVRQEEKISIEVNQ
jgi:hypothetical protein